MHAVYLPLPSLADSDRAGEDSFGLLAEGGPDSRTLSAIFLRIKNDCKGNRIPLMCVSLSL